MILRGFARESGAYIEASGDTLEAAMAEFKIAEQHADSVHVQLVALLDDKAPARDDYTRPGVAPYWGKR